MKTTVLIVSILIGALFSNSILAQEKNELKFSYGLSTIDIGVPATLRITDFGAAVAISIPPTIFNSHDTLTLNYNFIKEIKGSGTLSVNYSRRLNRRISIGSQINYSYFKFRREGENWKHVHVPIPFAKFNFRYIVKPSLEMYSSAMLVPIPIGNILPFHVTGLGFRHGKQHAVFC